VALLLNLLITARKVTALFLFCNLYTGQPELPYAFGRNSSAAFAISFPAVPLSYSLPYLSLCLNSRFMISAAQTACCQLSSALASPRQTGC